MAEGAPLLREYVGKTCIEGSNPSGSAKTPFHGVSSSLKTRLNPSVHAGLVISCASRRFLIPPFLGHVSGYRFRGFPCPGKLVDALSDVAVRNAKPALRDGMPVDRKPHDGRGLYLLVRGNGAKHWRLKYHLAGRERLRALGEYPNVTLTRARQKAGEARNLVREGIDPVQDGREQKALRVNASLQTFAVVADEWLIKKTKKWTDGHLEQNRQSLRDYVLPKIGARAIAWMRESMGCHAFAAIFRRFWVAISWESVKDSSGGPLLPFEPAKSTSESDCDPSFVAIGCRRSLSDSLAQAAYPRPKCRRG